MYDQDTNWPKQLLMGVGVLVAVALLIGGIVGLVAVKATDFAGVGDDNTGTSEPEELVIPERSPSPSPEETDDSSAAPTDGADEPKKSDKPKKEKKPRRPITLSASPTTVSQMGRIDLTGTYRGGNGATLQVQRFEGGWENFPVDVTVRGSTFSTWIQSGREGMNRFRVVDTDTGRASNQVRVRIG